MISINLYVGILLICTLLSLGIVTLMIIKKKKTKTDYLFLTLISLILIWCSTNLIDFLISDHRTTNLLIKYFAIIFSPQIFLLLSFTFTKRTLNFKKTLLIFTIPTITFIILLTNNLHGWFYEHYSIFRYEAITGWYYQYIHIVYSYTCMIIGFYNFLYSSLKNKGLMSKQAILIFSGGLIPLILNMLYVFGFLSDLDPTPIAFVFLIVCFWLAIIKYDFLKVIPIAHQTIIDNISDGFIIIDKKYKILEFNKVFHNQFRTVYDIKLKTDILELFKTVNFYDENKQSLSDTIKTSLANSQSEQIQTTAQISGQTLHFIIDKNPIFEKGQQVATIMLFKDITQKILNLEMIRENEARLLQAEKYSFLGELTGGLTHIVKNKISSLSYYAMFFDVILPDYLNLINKIEDPEQKQEELEVYEEIKKRIKGIHESVRTVERMVVNITNQISELSREAELTQGASFTLQEFLERIQSFVELEAKEGYDVQVQVEDNLKGVLRFEGVLANFIQAILNIFSNSVYEYKKLGINKPLILKIEKSKQKDNIINFNIIDFGDGIAEDIREALFKRMVTTKGNEGAGIGLYTSATVIREKLKGDIILQDANNGTHFLVELPLLCENTQEG